jgi:hypothetical protein
LDRNAKELKSAKFFLKPKLRRKNQSVKIDTKHTASSFLKQSDFNRIRYVFSLDCDKICYPENFRDFT